MKWEYIAGFFDGEGSLTHNGKSYRVTIAQANFEVLELIHSYTHLGHIRKERKREAHWKESWVYYIARQEDVLKFLLKVRPFLIVKKEKTEKCLPFLEKTVRSMADKKNKLSTTFAQKYPIQILIAEDNPVNQTLAIRTLHKLGYEPGLAENGKQAIEEIERSHYDVILMDVQMPEMDGLEATRIIRKLTYAVQPHIIAMTANAMEGDREMCIAAGMNDYISKPIRVNELVEALVKAKRK